MIKEFKIIGKLLKILNEKELLVKYEEIKKNGVNEELLNDLLCDINNSKKQLTLTIGSCYSRVKPIQNLIIYHHLLKKYRTRDKIVIAFDFLNIINNSIKK